MSKINILQVSMHIHLHRKREKNPNCLFRWGETLQKLSGVTKISNKITPNNGLSVCWVFKKKKKKNKKIIFVFTSVIRLLYPKTNICKDTSWIDILLYFRKWRQTFRHSISTFYLFLGCSVCEARTKKLCPVHFVQIFCFFT